LRLTNDNSLVNSNMKESQRTLFYSSFQNPSTQEQGFKKQEDEISQVINDHAEVINKGLERKETKY